MGQLQHIDTYSTLLHLSTLFACVRCLVLHSATDAGAGLGHTLMMTSRCSSMRLKATTSTLNLR